MIYAQRIPLSSTHNENMPLIRIKEEKALTKLLQTPGKIKIRVNSYFEELRTYNVMTMI